MRIDHLHIDRFGLIADQTVPALSLGMTCFLGRNEAGKSTCLRFFQSMLFGYRRGKSSLDPISARPGKSLAGGSLFLHSEAAGDLVLTRRPGPRGGQLTLADTSGLLLHKADETGEALLSRLFGGMTMDVFDAIFAFSLKELMEVSSLSGEKVRHALHGAAFGQGLRSPAQVLKRLDDRMALLLKADRGSAAINNVWRELKDVQEKLLDREPEVAQYAALNAELETLDAELARLRSERDMREASLRRSRRREDLWQQWETLGRVQGELQELGANEIGAEDEAPGGGTPPGIKGSPPELPPPAFAPDAVQRLDALLARREERLLAVNAQERALARLDEELAGLHGDDFTHEEEALLGKVQSLREQKERRRAEAESLPALLAECDGLATMQEESLATLGPGWNCERIATLDLSLASGQALLDAGNQVLRLTDSLERLADDCRRLTEERDEAARQVEEAARRVPPEHALKEDPPDKDCAARLAGAMADAASRLAELPDLLERRNRADADSRLARESLDPLLTADALRAIDISPAARHGLVSSAADCAAAARRLDTAEQLLRLAVERAEEAQRRFGQWLSRVDAHADLPEGSVLAGRLRLLRRLRTTLSDLSAARTASEEAEKLLAGHNPSPTSPLSLGRNPLFLAGTQLVLAGISLTTGGLIGSLPSLFYAGVVMALLGLPLCLLHRAAARPEGADSAGEGAPPGVREAAESAARRLATLENGLSALHAEASPWLAGAFPPDEETLEQAALALEDQSRALAMAERDRAELADAQTVLDAALQEKNRAETEHGRAKEGHKAAMAAHGKGIAALGLVRSVPPEEVKALLEAISGAILRDEAAREAAVRVTTAASRVVVCFDIARAHPFFANALRQTENTAAAPSFLYDAGDLERADARAAAAAGMADLARAMAALEALREQAQEMRNAASILQERQEAAERVGRRLALAETARNEAEKALEGARLARRQALASFELPKTVSPESAVEALALMRSITARDKDIRARKERIANLEAALDAFALAVVELAKGMNIPVLSALAPASPVDRTPPSRRIPAALALLDTLAARAEEASRKASDRNARQEQRVHHALRLEESREALALTESDLRELLASANSPDAASFRAAFARYTRIEELRREERSLLDALRRLAAEEENTLDALLGSFARSNPEELRRHAAALDDELAALNADMAKYSQRRGALLERRAGLVGEHEADTSADLRRREAGLRVELHRLSRRWAVPALARELLLAAKERFEREGRQGVLRHAGDIFRAVTGDEYTGITLGLDGESFLAMHHSGDLRDPEKQLSQGTREQLYLALRLAFIRNHAEKAESMPVFMDDILVNFDPQRAAAAAGVLATFAETNQLLFFTCHPATADTLMRAAEGAAPAPLAYCIDKGSIHAA